MKSELLQINIEKDTRINTAGNLLILMVVLLAMVSSKKTMSATAADMAAAGEEPFAVHVRIKALLPRIEKMIVDPNEYASGGGSGPMVVHLMMLEELLQHPGSKPIPPGKSKPVVFASVGNVSEFAIAQSWRVAAFTGSEIGKSVPCTPGAIPFRQGGWEGVIRIADIPPGRQTQVCLELSSTDPGTPEFGLLLEGTSPVPSIANRVTPAFQKLWDLLAEDSDLNPDRPGIPFQRNDIGCGTVSAMQAGDLVVTPIGLPVMEFDPRPDPAQKRAGVIRPFATWFDGKTPPFGFERVAAILSDKVAVLDKTNWNFHVSDAVVPLREPIKTRFKILVRLEPPADPEDGPPKLRLTVRPTAVPLP